MLLLATVIVVDSHLHVRGYAVAYLVYLVAAGLGALALASWFVRPTSPAPREPGLAGCCAASLPLGQFDIFAIIYARADSVMLYFISGNRAVALYCGRVPDRRLLCSRSRRCFPMRSFRSS